MQFFSESRRQGRRGFIALTTAALASVTIKAQTKKPPIKQAEADSVPDDVSPADSLMLYIDLLDGVKESILDLEIRELSDLKSLVSERFQAIIYEGNQVKPNSSDPEAVTRLLQTIKQSESLQKRFDDERTKRLEAIRTTGSKVDAIKKTIVETATILRGFKTMNSRSESAHAVHSAATTKAAASAKLKSAIGKIRELTQSSMAVSNYQAETLVMILDAVDRSINKPEVNPTGKKTIDQKKTLKNAHATGEMTVTQAKQRAKQIIREKFPPGLFLQVWIGFAGVWHILEGVFDEADRRRLLTDCLKVVPSWGADRDGAAGELAKLRYQ